MPYILGCKAKFRFLHWIVGILLFTPGAINNFDEAHIVSLSFALRAHELNLNWMMIYALTLEEVVKLLSPNRFPKKYLGFGLERIVFFPKSSVGTWLLLNHFVRMDYACLIESLRENLDRTLVSPR